MGVINFSKNPFRTFLLCFICVLLQFGCMQKKDIYTVKYKANVNTTYSNQPDFIIDKNKMISDSFKFIFYKNHQILTLRESIKGEFEGTVLSYIYHENKKDQFAIDEIFNVYRYERVDTLKTSDAKSLILLLKTMKFDDFLDSDEIDDYNLNWLDCSTSKYKIIRVNDTLNFTYPCLHNQDSLPALDEIRYIDSTIMSRIQFRDLYSGFIDKLPKGKSYRRDHINVYVSTDEQVKYRHQYAPRINYENETQDSITGIFEKIINSAYNRLDSFSREEFSEMCYVEFEVVYDREGKLVSVIGADIDRYDRDKDYRNCKKAVTKFLKSIDINYVFIYPQVKWMYFYEDEVEIEDRRVF